MLECMSVTRLPRYTSLGDDSDLWLGNLRHLGHLKAPHSHPLLVVVLPGVLLEAAGQGEVGDAVVAGVAADGGPGELLQGGRVGPGQRGGQHGLEEHAEVGVLVVLQESADGVGGVDAGVVGVEAELVLPLLDAGVQRPSVAAEAHREDKLVVGTVAEQEGALGLVLGLNLLDFLVCSGIVFKEKVDGF